MSKSERNGGFVLGGESPKNRAAPKLDTNKRAAHDE